jgi:nucleoside-diphosphate-sugar epimerase
VEDQGNHSPTLPSSGRPTHYEKLQETINEIRPEIIFHLAVHRAHLSQRDRWETLQTNILGTTNLLEATMPLNYQRFVHIGSSLEYGVRKRPLKESDRLEPVTFFGATKAAAALLCQQFARANRLPIVVLRLFSVYGYWEAPTRLVPTGIMAALRDREIALTTPGYRRDFVFVEDVVEACLLSLQAERVVGEVINVGSGQQWSNEEVVEMVQAVSGQKVKVRAGEYPPRPSDTTNWVADNRKAKRLLGWKPRHTLRNGLEKTIAWFRLHQEAYADSSI